MNAIAPHAPLHPAAGGSPAVLDMIIVGAGISGIGMAVHLTRDCPGKTFAMLDRRERLGGTWDLFRYPGIRSDSDMHTLGFAFAPWRHEKSIADGPAILDYLEDIADRYDLAPKMRFGRKVIAAAFDSDTAVWTVTAETEDGHSETLRGRFLFLGAGYYDYDEPYDAEFPGRESFQGRIVHPQFWPQDLDYTGKKVVVIGSGATAVTIVPAMASSGAGHVTMLQRTPTWMASRPAKDAIANTLRKVLPETLAYKLTRAKNIVMQDIVFRRARTQPEKVKAFLTGQMKANLGPHYDEAAFTPPYDPWNQRLCLVPDADFFEAIKAGTAGVVTGRIKAFDPSGIVLESGEHLDADIIVTATGLKLAFAGKIAVSVDGAPVNFADHFCYRNCMFSNLPNLAAVFGYLNASWTLRVDIVADYITRLLRQMDANAMQIAIPTLDDSARPAEDDIFDFSSGYIQRGKHLMPRNAAALPWRLNQNYRQDRRDMREAPLDDGILALRRVRQPAEA